MNIRSLWRSKPKKKGYFIHVPKTAGGSIRYFCKQVGFEIVGHDVRDPGYMPFHEYPDRQAYFSFCFVRHPAERALSAFRFLSQGGINEGDQLDAEKFVLPYSGDFNNFVKEELQNGEVIEQLHFSPQHQWITDQDGNRCVDFVGRFESLETDLNKITRLLRTEHFNLPVKNKSTLSAEGIDKAALAILEQVYAEDYQMFGYGRSTS